MLYNNGRTYLLCVIFVHAPCFQQIQQLVRACEFKQRARNVPAEGDERKNKFETCSSNFNGLFIGLYGDNGKENGNYCLGFRV